MVTHAETEGRVKGKNRAEYVPEERRMGPNRKGWQEKIWLAQVEAIGCDYCTSMEELA